MIFRFLFLICNLISLTKLPSQIEEKYGRDSRLTFYKCEKLYYRVHKLTLDSIFIKKCLLYQLTPKFIRFKLYSRRQMLRPGYKSFQRSLLTSELQFIQSRLKKTTKIYEDTLATLQSRVGPITRLKVKLFMKRYTQKKITEVEETHSKKLQKLGLITVTRDTTKIVQNFSSRKLTEDETQLLAKGLKHPVFPTLKLLDMKADLEIFYAKFVKFYSENQLLDLKITLLNVFNNIRKNYFWLKNNNVYNQKNDLETLNNLKNDKSIVILKFDKGNGVVILDKSDYIKKMLVILNDKDKFVQVDSYDVIKHESSVQNKLKYLVDQNKFNKDVYNKIRPRGSVVPKMYGLPKVHKVGTPCRPIVSQINSPTYNLAKWLSDVCSPFRRHTSIIKDTFSFINTLKDISFFNDNEVMASFDVSSLFTNIPLNETIDLLLNKVFQDKNIFHGLNRKEFRRLLNICCHDCVFSFNNFFYKQVDGIAMGSPLAPLLADIFMNHLCETSVANSTYEFLPRIFYRYVDDTFVIFRKFEHIFLFNNYINNLHHNIKFTYELESDGKLPFLDILIERDGFRFITSVFRKSSNTDLYTNFLALSEKKYKINLLSCLVFRAFKICNSIDKFKIELLNISNILKINSFPSDLVRSKIAFFANKLQNETRCSFCDSVKCRCPSIHCVKCYSYNVHYCEKCNNCCVHCSTCFCESNVLKLSYLGEITEFTMKKIRVATSKFEKVKVKLITFSPCRISSFFKIKDFSPALLRSNVVYQVNCDCGEFYIGKTE